MVYLEKDAMVAATINNGTTAAEEKVATNRTDVNEMAENVENAASKVALPLRIVENGIAPSHTGIETLEGKMAALNGVNGCPTDTPLPRLPTAEGSTKGTGFVPKKLRIVMLGAGVSGIQFAYSAANTMTNYDLDIYDKNPTLGGTWYENRYPGCACDIPSHTYQFSWAPNPSWSKFYSPAPEILSYLERVVTEHNLRRFMHFNHKAVHASWQPSKCTWRVVLERSDSEGNKIDTIVKEAEILISGVGTLNNWKWPDIEGLGRFKGPVLHTANWDNTVDLKGKKVAVIGNGASAVQVVPAIQPVVSKLTNYFRTASWMLPHMFSDGKVQMDYPAELRKKFETDPAYYYEYRRRVEIVMASGFETLWRGSNASKEMLSMTKDHMREMIKDPEILRKLMPEWELGCRRFTPGDHYLEAVQKPNAEMVNDPIKEVLEHGILGESGTVREADVIVCATGFDASFEPRLPIIGLDGYELSQNWGKDKTTESYMSCCVAKFPNFFTFCAPICPVIGSAFPGIEGSCEYIMKLIHRLQTDRIKWMAPKENAQVEFNQWAQSRHKEMAFSGDCKSWYKNSSGKVFIPWPGTVLHFRATTEYVRWEDFAITWEDPKQKYASLGNGITVEGFATSRPSWLGPPPKGLEVYENF